MYHIADCCVSVQELWIIGSRHESTARGPGQARNGTQGISRLLGLGSWGMELCKSRARRHTHAEDGGGTERARSGWPTGQHKKQQLQRDGDAMRSWQWKLDFHEFLFSSHEHFQVNDYVFSPHKDFSDFVFPSCDFISFSFFKYTFTLKNCGSGTLVNNFSALKTTSGTPAGSHTASAKSQMDAFFSSTEDHSCLSMLGFIQTCWHVGTVKEGLLCGCKGPGKLRWIITDHHLCLILSLIW